MIPAVAYSGRRHDPLLGSSGTFLPVKGWSFFMATVTYDNATRIYPGSDKPAVDKLNLEIADGEFMVLVGPSGCGKSTSLRMLAGLEEVDDGRIRIGDRDVTHLPPKDRDIAMVFQNYALYPHMTVAREHGLRAEDAGRAQGASARRRSARPRSCSTWRTTSTASRRPSPVASASASRWAARSSASRRSSSWTSRCPTSTPSCASRPVPRSPRCSPGSASPPSTSPTTRSRR